MLRTLATLLSVAALSVACRSVPTTTIPDPLPETLEWAVERNVGGGAFLGLEVRENDSGSLEALAFDPGVRVTRVAAGSPAEEVGLRVGDVLLRFGDTAVADPATLEVLLADAAEEEASLEVQRGDSVFTVPVRLRSREATVESPSLAWRADPARSRAGWIAGRGGVVLVTSDPDGPFPSAGVPVGSVVTALDGERVRSERALVRSFLDREPGERVTVDWIGPQTSDGEPRRAKVTLFEPPTRVTEATLPILAGYRTDPDGETANAYLLDLWLISLFRYRREGEERHYRFLRFFAFSTGVGELAEGE